MLSIIKPLILCNLKNIKFHLPFIIILKLPRFTVFGSIKTKISGTSVMMRLRGGVIL